MRTLVLVVLISAVACARVVYRYRKTDGNKVIQRYVVYPGLDASVDELDEWNTGYASPFNVYFGPKPYVIGWMGGEGPFAPIEPPDGAEEELEEEVEEEKGKNTKKEKKKE